MMNITRLGWAGVQLEADGELAVIDLLQNPGRMVDFVGELHTPMPAPTRTGASVALVTHLHQDHTDPDAIAEVLAEDGVLLRPAPADGHFLEIAGLLPAEKRLMELGIRQRFVAPWETVEVGAFKATAPAVDGFGDPQVGWVVEADGTRVFHGGDTLFHGSWWKIRMRTGTIDYAFLPINGAVVSLPHRQPPSPFNAVLTPDEAAAAAQILEAGEAIAIHYDAIHHPPVYVQVDDPAAAFLRAAEERGVTARIVEPGAAVTPQPAAA
jgi:L-ascorbate metabolism protein UlaG (beta-lactamase superfamily)